MVVASMLSKVSTSQKFAKTTKLPHRLAYPRENFAAAPLYV